MRNGEFCGTAFDLVSKAIAITKKTRQSLSDIKWIICDATRQVLHNFGILLFASEVIEMPLAAFYHSIKFLRHLCHKIEKGLLTLQDHIGSKKSVESVVSNYP